MPRQRNIYEVTELIKYVLFSDYVVLDEERKETPLSAIVVAPVESGKTAILDQFFPNTGILRMTDLTAWGLQKNYLRQLRNGDIRRIVIPDMINPANRKPETVNSLVTFFNSYISWEGVGNISTYAMQIKLDIPVKGSLLTTMAVGDFRRMVRTLAAVGFLSRLLIIAYRNSQSLAQEILLDIAEGRDGWGKVALNFPNEKQDVVLDAELARLLIPQAEVMGKRAEGYGARALHQLMMLSKCKALYEGRREVEKADIERVIHLAQDYLSRVPEITKKDREMMYHIPSMTTPRTSEEVAETVEDNVVSHKALLEDE